MGAALVALLDEPWDAPWHAPQHLLSRFARRFPVVVLEPPVLRTEERVEEREADGVRLVRAAQRAPGNRFDERTFAALGAAVGGEIALVWSFIPDGSVVADALNAPRFVRAGDLPRGVDVAAFSAPSNLEPHPLLQDLSAPVLTFAGTVDARIDPTLIAALGELDGVNVVLAGPVAEPLAAALPRLPNVHFTGRLERTAIPALLRASDAAIVPFTDPADDPPVQALEAFAAGVPVLTFAQIDAPWGAFTRFIADPRAVVQIAQEASDDPGARERARDYVRAYDWDDVAARVRESLDLV